MKIKEITGYLETLAPLSSQESYDNCGLLVGDSNTEVTEVLISLDCIEATVEEAIDIGCNLIIAHHPIIFGGLKKLNGKNYIERTVIKAIKHDIAIYAIHTNLDNYQFGVNHEIGSRLGLQNLRVLAPKRNVLSKLVCFCPEESSSLVMDAMFNAGAGNIGNYSNCSFVSKGVGSFKPEKNSNPVVGEIGEVSSGLENRLEVLVSNHLSYAVVSAMKKAHPYEEVAYELYPISNENQNEGSGMVGELKPPMELKEFLEMVKDKFNCGGIRYTNSIGKMVERVAFCGGSGSFLLSNAKRVRADVFITGDFKYHEFFDAESEIVIADIGHFESEQYTSMLLKRVLMKKFTKFAVHLTEVNTNPINYI
ncbi:MAG: Nif3-like dinuclear metal center hexameric protein [Crocinitomicaceae bacterium]|nr:Nif3-like dinuclear metal center hexameric protein [Crocinitomicaceae bacterium]